MSNFQVDQDILDVGIWPKFSYKFGYSPDSMFMQKIESYIRLKSGKGIHYFMKFSKVHQYPGTQDWDAIKFATTNLNFMRSFMEMIEKQRVFGNPVMCPFDCIDHYQPRMSNEDFMKKYLKL